MSIERRTEMERQHENRRVRMTKQLMKDALLELLEQQNLANISVTAICETADVHRSTFYKYYTDPVALLMEIEQDFLDRIPTPPKELNQQNQEQFLKVTTAYFDDVKENKKAYRILLGESTGNRFATRLVEYLCSGNIPVGGETDELTSCFVRLYIANGTVGMLREWVEKDCPVSSRKISEVMYFLSQKIAY